MKLFLFDSDVELQKMSWSDARRIARGLPPSNLLVRYPEGARRLDWFEGPPDEVTSIGTDPDLHVYGGQLAQYWGVPHRAGYRLIPASNPTPDSTEEVYRRGFRTHLQSDQGGEEEAGCPMGVPPDE